MSKLPIDSYLSKIHKASLSREMTIVRSAPGSGKTTRLPVYLMKYTNKKILVIQPRRVAARLPAIFIAEQLGEKVGQTIGYKVRFDNQSSDLSKVLFMTDGMVVKHLSDPKFLEQFEYVIFDEFHERSLNNDLCLALTEKYIQENRSDLRLILMSATLDVSEISERYPNAKIFEIEGKSYNVDVSYMAPIANEDIAHTVARAIDKISNSSRITGNILVFLTGKFEIERVSKYIRTKYLERFEVISFMSESAVKSMELINNGSSLPKIICATNVAETSITLPAVKYVIDGGERYQQVYAPWNGLPFIRKEKICQDSAIQRTGRAGRLADGVCIRLYSESDFISRMRFNDPEIKRSDLCGLIIDSMLAAKIDNVKLLDESLSFLTPPPRDSLRSAIEILTLIKLLDKEGYLKNLDGDLKRLSFHPRLIAAYIESKKIGAPNLGIAIVAIIEVGGFLKTDSKLNFFHESDFLLQCEIIFEKTQGVKSKYPRNLVDQKKLNETLKLFNLLRVETELIPDNITLEAVNLILLAGFPDRVTRVLPKYKIIQEKLRKKGEIFRGGRYLFTMGKSASLSQDSRVQGHQILISPLALEKRIKGKKEIYLHMVSSISENLLINSGSDLLVRSSTIETKHVKGDYKFEKKERLLYGQIVLSEITQDLDNDEIASTLKDMIKESFPFCFNDHDFLKCYLNKLDCIDSLGLEHNFPRFENDFLDLFLEIIVEGKRSTDEVFEKSLEEYISEVLSYEQAILLDQICPKTLTLSNKKTLKIEWSSGGEPVISSKIQNFYGVCESLSVGTRNIRPKIVLLGPDGRPMQVTSDLIAFFNGSYLDVSREYKRRFPKHYWPDTPQSAAPIYLKRLVK